LNLAQGGLNINKGEKRFHLLGWLLFLVCAVFFIMQSLKSNNILGLTGSVIFLIGCVAFLIPLVLGWKNKQRKGE
jgi:predicted membrane channel-forming protein YqfA (hemolysin III family)